jgi:sec-independent protein translocase protein TatA
MNTVLFGDGIFGLGAPELIIILVILLLLFGGKKLPELAKSLGSSVAELKKGVNGSETPTKPSQSSDSSQQ